MGYGLARTARPLPMVLKRYTIKGNDFFSVAWNFNIDMTADDYIEM